jgi:hypothetical protein
MAVFVLVLGQAEAHVAAVAQLALGAVKMSLVVVATELHKPHSIHKPREQQQQRATCQSFCLKASF